MKRILYVPIILILACGLACNEKRRPGEAFGLTVDSITVEGTVSDNLDINPAVTIDGNSASITSGAFTNTFIGTTSTTGKDAFIIEAADKVPNKTSEVFEIR